MAEAVSSPVSKIYEECEKISATSDYGIRIYEPLKKKEFFIKKLPEIKGFKLYKHNIFTTANQFLIQMRYSRCLTAEKSSKAFVGTQ